MTGARTRIIILHFEDQVGGSVFIPRSIKLALPHLWAQLGFVVRALDPGDEESEDECCFHYAFDGPNGASLDVYYQFVDEPTIDALERAARELESVALIFIDAGWGEQALGIDLYNAIVAQNVISRNKLYFLTGIPDQVMQRLSWQYDHPNLIRKPVNISELKAMILREIRSVKLKLGE